MIENNKRTLIFLTALIGFLFLAGIAEANGTRTFEAIFKKLTETFVTWAQYLAGVAIGVCVILIASSGGDPRRLSDAKRALVYLVIGLAIVSVGSTIIIPGGGDFATNVKEIAKDLGAVAMIIGAIVLSYGIFEFAVSGGDPTKLRDAQMVVFWAIAGIGLGALVQGGTLSAISGWKVGVEEISKILGYLAMIIGVGFISLGIFRFIISRGDPRMMGEARDNVFWGIVAAGLGGLLFDVAKVLSWFGINI